jgi:hypothetical protein
VEGDRYVVAVPASGVWAGHDNEIAEYVSSSWTYDTVAEGDAVWLEDEDKLVTWNGASWANFGSTIDHSTLYDLLSDDHTQYLLAAGTRALTADWNIGNYKIIWNTDTNLYRASANKLATDDDLYISNPLTSGDRTLEIAIPTAYSGGKPVLKLTNTPGGGGSVSATIDFSNGNINIDTPIRGYSYDTRGGNVYLQGGKLLGYNSAEIGSSTDSEKMNACYVKWEYGFGAEANKYTLCATINPWYPDTGMSYTDLLLYYRGSGNVDNGLSVTGDKKDKNSYLRIWGNSTTTAGTGIPYLYFAQGRTVGTVYPANQTSLYYGGLLSSYPVIQTSDHFYITRSLYIGDSSTKIWNNGAYGLFFEHPNKAFRFIGAIHGQHGGTVYDIGESDYPWGGVYAGGYWLGKGVSGSPKVAFTSYNTYEGQMLCFDAGPDSTFGLQITSI